jgi:galactoside O-acetyltransferase
MNPFDPGYWCEDELEGFGFKCGRHVMVAKNCTIIGLENKSFANISFGDHVRIDGFTTIAAASGHLTVGSYVHIGGYCFLTCAGGVTLEDFTGLSQRVSIYSSSDDYSGAALTNPMVPRRFTNVRTEPVRLGRHVIIGASAVVLPGVTIGVGSSVGALSLVHRSLPEWGVYSGIPAKRIRERSRDLLDAEARLTSGT